MLSAALVLMWGPAALAGGMVGVDWTPFGRGDLAWVESDQLSGTLSAETDGMLNGPLGLWGGWTARRHAVLGHLRTVRITTTTWGATPDDQGDMVTRIRVGAVRPGLDYRYYFVDRTPGRALPWVTAGAYSVFPTVQYESETWTEEEQDGWEETALEDENRIAGYGFSLGGGAEVMFFNGLVVGARQSFVAHRGRRVDEDAIAVTVLLRSETALTLGFQF